MRNKKIKQVFFLIFLTTVTSIVVQLIVFHQTSVIASLPPEDIPEEILRTEIFIEARSPIDGKPLTPGEYAQLQAELKTRPYPPQLNPRVRETVFLLRLRKILKTLFPFVNF